MARHCQETEHIWKPELSDVVKSITYNDGKRLSARIEGIARIFPRPVENGNQAKQGSVKSPRFVVTGLDWGLWRMVTRLHGLPWFFGACGERDGGQRHGPGRECCTGQLLPLPRRTAGQRTRCGTLRTDARPDYISAVAWQPLPGVGRWLKDSLYQASGGESDSVFGADLARVTSPGSPQGFSEDKFVRLDIPASRPAHRHHTRLVLASVVGLVETSFYQKLQVTSRRGFTRANNARLVVNDLPRNDPSASGGGTPTAINACLRARNNPPPP
ncbi:hypothetical protein Bbelb_098210 [Branchiostoma belcheri]|nr:hypothetical protein Bbelb_098210 [Branchiostoma belcheri]